MCNCIEKSKRTQGHAEYMADLFHKATGEETVLIEQAPQEFVFETTRRPLDKSKYDITVENGRKIYVLKQINKN